MKTGTTCLAAVAVLLGLAAACADEDGGGATNQATTDDDAPTDDDQGVMDDEPAGDDDAPGDDDQGAMDDEPAGDDDAPAGDDDAPTGDDDEPAGDDDAPAPAVGGECSLPAPCGGDVVGRWEVTEVCLDAELGFVAELPPECADAFLGLEVTNQDVVLEFTADGISTAQGSIGIQMQTRYSAECLSTLGLTEATEETCAQLGVAVSQDGDLAATCTLDVDACACEFVQTEVVDEMDTYALSGNQIIEGESVHDYCVEGTTLTVADDDSNSSYIAELVR